MHLLGSWPTFSHFLHYPQANWALLVLTPRWRCLCTFHDPVGLSNRLSFEVGSFSHHRNPHLCLPPEALRIYFPALEPWVLWSFSLPSCSSQVIPTKIWYNLVHQLPPGPLSPPVATLLCVLSIQLPVSVPPTSLNKYFFFNSLVVELPYSFIFWQF